MSSPAEEPCPTADGVGRVEDCRWGSSGEEGEDDLSSDDEEDVVPFEVVHLGPSLGQNGAPRHHCVDTHHPILNNVDAIARRGRTGREPAGKEAAPCLCDTAIGWR
jgi:hypothetical protein